jgi:hypothetical protein
VSRRAAETVRAAAVVVRVRRATVWSPPGVVSVSVSGAGLFSCFGVRLVAAAAAAAGLTPTLPSAVNPVSCGVGVGVGGVGWLSD